MQTLYISRQGCQLSLKQNTVLIKQQSTVLDTVQLPLVNQILIFGRSQVTTPVTQACLQRQIPLAYLSQQGRCYGRLMPTDTQAHRLILAQSMRTEAERLAVAQALVVAKVNNGRVLLMRQRRRLADEALEGAIASLADLAQAAAVATTIPQLLGLEGAAAAVYFRGLGRCVSNSAFEFTTRSRRPPLDPINALLSFGYQLLWNHLLLLIELQGLSAYWACLHQPGDNHPALASDLIEPFRAPLVDSLVLYLVNRAMVDPQEDFDYPSGACYLNGSGRRIFLQAFLLRMNELITTPSGQQPRWDVLTQQVMAHRDWCLEPGSMYTPYGIR